MEVVLGAFSAIEHRLTAQRRGLALTRLMGLLESQLERVPRMVQMLFNGVKDVTLDALSRQQFDERSLRMVKEVLEQAGNSAFQRVETWGFGACAKQALVELRTTEADVRSVLLHIQEELEAEWRDQKMRELEQKYRVDVDVSFLDFFNF